MSYWGSMFTSIAEAAKALSISERHLYRLIRENRVPFYNLSPRTTRVDLNELRDYMRLITRGPRADGREGFPRSHLIERINPGSLMITKLVYTTMGLYRICFRPGICPSQAVVVTPFATPNIQEGAEGS